MKMDSARRNLVLGCGTDYSAEKLAPFASTLRGAGYDGAIALVIYEDQSKALKEIGDAYAIQWIPIARYPSWLPPGVARRLQNRGRMRWVHRSLEFTLPPLLGNASLLKMTGMQLQHFYHIACGRYFIYYTWLCRQRHLFENVLLTDVRDVIFQGDPFAYPTDGALHCYMDPSVKLGDEPVNMDWMTMAYGSDGCKQYLGRRISCSGTTMGDVASILEYLRKMGIALIEILSRITGWPGVDQAVHNRLLWDNRLDGVRLCENGGHSVMTLKNADARGFNFDGDHRLLNDDGRPAPVLHQYDFHPEFFSRRTPELQGNANTRS
jgi:hypothetical protein